MKTLKLLGIAALSALLVFGITACGDPEENLPDGHLRVSSFYGPYSGKPITAVWDGTPEDVDFEWLLDGVSIATTEENDRSTCTPSKGGTLELVLTAKGYDPLKRSFTIEDAPAYIDYLGKWTMFGDKKSNPDNSAWITDGNTGNEYLEITKDHYKLTSDTKTNNVNEFFYFAINDNGWAVKSTASTTDSSYTSGYTITGKITDQLGGYGTTGAEISFAIYLDATKKLQVSDRTKQSGAAQAKRYYERNEAEPIYFD